MALSIRIAAKLMKRMPSQPAATSGSFCCAVPQLVEADHRRRCSGRCLRARAAASPMPSPSALQPHLVRVGRRCRGGCALSAAPSRVAVRRPATASCAGPPASGRGRKLPTISTSKKVPLTNIVRHVAHLAGPSCSRKPSLASDRQRRRASPAARRPWVAGWPCTGRQRSSSAVAAGLTAPRVPGRSAAPAAGPAPASSRRGESKSATTVRAGQAAAGVRVGSWQQRGPSPAAAGSVGARRLQVVELHRAAVSAETRVDEAHRRARRASAGACGGASAELHRWRASRRAGVRSATRKLQPGCSSTPPSGPRAKLK